MVLLVNPDQTVHMSTVFILISYLHHHFFKIYISAMILHFWTDSSEQTV